MPYIKKEERKVYDEKIDQILSVLTNTANLECNSNGWKGQLNYIVSKLCHGVIEANGLKYHNLNDIIGVLECVKQELYRTVAAPYEDVKCCENGDISTLTESPELNL